MFPAHYYLSISIFCGILWLNFHGNPNSASNQLRQLHSFILYPIGSTSNIRQRLCFSWIVYSLNALTSHGPRLIGKDMLLQSLARHSFDEQHVFKFMIGCSNGLYPLIKVSVAHTSQVRLCVVLYVSYVIANTFCTVPRRASFSYTPMTSHQ